MAISSYKAYGRTLWEYDFRHNGQRHRKGGIPTKEQAKKAEHEARQEAFEGTLTTTRRRDRHTVNQAWEAFKKVSERDKKSHKSDLSRAKHLVRHLGDRQCSQLTVADVDAYRTLRLAEPTVRGDKPSPATLDREVELLRRMLGYACECGKLRTNPLAGVKLLRVPNVREVVVTEGQLEAMLSAVSKLNTKAKTRRFAQADQLPAILLLLFTTGMRKREVLDLRWERLDLREGKITLPPTATKEEKPRIIYLRGRVLDALKALPRSLSGWVFCNRKGKPWSDVSRHAMEQLWKAAEIKGGCVHDLRHAFATLTRRAGIAESVVQRMGGWSTPSVFKRYNLVDEADLRAARDHLDGQEAPDTDSPGKSASEKP